MFLRCRRLSPSCVGDVVEAKVIVIVCYVRVWICLFHLLPDVLSPPPLRVCVCVCVNEDDEQHHRGCPRPPRRQSQRARRGGCSRRSCPPGPRRLLLPAVVVVGATLTVVEFLAVAHERHALVGVHAARARRVRVGRALLAFRAVLGRRIAGAGHPAVRHGNETR